MAKMTIEKLQRLGRSLEQVYPDVVNLWNYDLNEDTPLQVTFGSKEKRYFNCKKGCIYLCLINNMSKKQPSNCPYCTGRKLGYGNDLATNYPEVAKQWDYELNEDTPYDVFAKTAKKRWFKCKNNHSTLVKVHHKTNSNTNCAYCSGKKVGYGNDLATNYPKLLKMWHKDNAKKPNEVTPGSNYKAKLICTNNHVYEQRVSHLTNGIGCPRCYDLSTVSKIENDIFNELLKYIDVKQQGYVGGYRPDIVTGKTIIEYDGSYFHKDSYEKDVLKTQIYNKKGYKVIRIREVYKKQHTLREIPNCKNIEFNYRKYDIKGLVEDILKEIKGVNYDRTSS